MSLSTERTQTSPTDDSGIVVSKSGNRQSSCRSMKYSVHRTAQMTTSEPDADYGDDIWGYVHRHLRDHDEQRSWATSETFSECGTGGTEYARRVYTAGASRRSASIRLDRPKFVVETLCLVAPINGPQHTSPHANSIRHFKNTVRILALTLRVLPTRLHYYSNAALALVLFSQLGIGRRCPGTAHRVRPLTQE